VSVIFTIVTPSDGDNVTSYDTGTLIGSVVTGSYDITEFDKHVSLFLMSPGGPTGKTIDNFHIRGEN